MAGCGGDELSEEEFRSQANAACENYNERLGEVDPAESLEEVPQFLESTEPLLDDLISDLRDIDAPESVGDDYDRLVEGYGGVRDTIEDVRNAAEDQDQAELQRIGEGAQEQSAEVERLAGELGIERCGAQAG